MDERPCDGIALPRLSFGDPGISNNRSIKGSCRSSRRTVHWREVAIYWEWARYGPDIVIIVTMISRLRITEVPSGSHRLQPETTWRTQRQ